MSGICLAPHVGDTEGTISKSYKRLSIKPGSAGKAMPGFDVRVVDDNGNEVKRGKMGNIVLAIPLAPTSFTTLWEDEERFYNGYLKRFSGKWVDTGGRSFVYAWKSFANRKFDRCRHDRCFWVHQHHESE